MLRAATFVLNSGKTTALRTAVFQLVKLLDRGRHFLSPLPNQWRVKRPMDVSLSATVRLCSVLHRKYVFKTVYG